MNPPGRGRGDHAANFCKQRRIAGNELRPEPAPRRGLHQRFHSLLADYRKALLPEFPCSRWTDPLAVASDHAIEALGVTRGQPKRGDRAHGDAYESCARNGQGVEQGDDIIHQLLEAAGFARDFSTAMASLVVAQNAEGIFEGSNLPVPQRKICRQGIGKHQPWRILTSVDPAVKANSVRFRVEAGTSIKHAGWWVLLRHDCSFCRSLKKSRRYFR